MRIYTYVKIFIKNKKIFELGIGIASSFSRTALNAFWKRALQVHLLQTEESSIRKPTYTHGV